MAWDSGIGAQSTEVHNIAVRLGLLRTRSLGAPTGVAEQSQKLQTVSALPGMFGTQHPSGEQPRSNITACICAQEETE
jgi:hypothetical protein